MYWPHHSMKNLASFKAWPIGLSTIAGLVVISLLLGCAGSAPLKKVSLKNGSQDVAAKPFQPGKTALRVAIAGVISPKETFRTYDRLLDYFGEKLDRPVQLVQRSTYGEINELLRSGNVDLAFVCSAAYVEGNRTFGMELLVVPEILGLTTYHSYVIVPGDSLARQVQDLKGKTFAFTDPLSNSGRLAPTYMLLQMGETPESFFSKYVFTYSHDNSIKAVAEKLVDAAAVDSLVYDFHAVRNSPLTARTRVIWKSPPYGSPPVVVHPEINPQLKVQLRDVLLGMDQDPVGKGILDDLMIDRFVVADAQAYESIRSMDAKVRSQGEGK